MKSLMPCFLILSVILLSASVQAKLNVVTSIQTLASLAEEVGGDKVSVQSLSKGYMDPHFVEPKPNLVLTLHNADLLIDVGLELEVGWLPPLVLNSRNSKIKGGQDGRLEAATVIHILKVPTVKVDRSMGDIHPGGNPHFWIPPKNGIQVARAIRDRLKKIDSANGAYYDSQFDKFSKKITDLEASLEPKVKKFKGMKVVPYHDSWAYVSDWLGFQEAGYVEIKPGVPPDPQHLVELINQMKEAKVKAILMENFYNKDIATNVAEKSGAKLLIMPSDVGATSAINSYTDLVKAVVDKVSEAQ